MSNVVVSVSSSCLDSEKIPNNIRMLRYHIHIDEASYIDGKTITIKQMTDMMRIDSNLTPVSSAPTTEEIGDFFYQLMQEGFKEVYVICVSSKLSQVYKSITNLRSMFASRIRIHVYDTRSVSYVEGRIALSVSRLLKQRQSHQKIEKQIEYMRDNSHTWFVVDDLSHLIRSKRLSAPAGFFANLLEIKPLLEIDNDGKIQILERIRKLDIALTTLCETAINKANQTNAKLCVMSAFDDNLRVFVLDYLKKRGFTDVTVAPFSAVILANMGVKGVGIATFQDHEI